MYPYNRSTVLGTVFKVMPLKQLDSGSAILSFTIDVDDSYTNKEGTNVPRSFKIDAELWGPLATKHMNDIVAGNLVLVEGALKLSSWDDQSGVKKYKHFITAKQIVSFNTPSSQEQEVLKNREACLYQDNPF
jgi:single-strand DNA-binding protein